MRGGWKRGAERNALGRSRGGFSTKINARINAEGLPIGIVTPVADHLARHRHADLFLDTLPFNAHTTASDALWSGVPVVTCLGSTFAGRVCASLLTAVGLPELIAQTSEDYEALALKLAQESDLLAGVKVKLAHNRLTEPLFDTTRFTSRIEAAYQLMWERSKRGEARPPASRSQPFDETFEAILYRFQVTGSG